jgi:hypothetical protein
MKAMITRSTTPEESKTLFLAIREAATLQPQIAPKVAKTLLNAVHEGRVTLREAEDIGTAMIEAGMVQTTAVLKHLQKHSVMEVCEALNLRRDLEFDGGGENAPSLPMIFRAMEDTGFPVNGTPNQLDYDAVCEAIANYDFTFVREVEEKVINLFTGEVEYRPKKRLMRAQGFKNRGGWADDDE